MLRICVFGINMLTLMMFASAELVFLKTVLILKSEGEIMFVCGSVG